mmetsp:Transcript_28088/g.38633  ORF Transcript_28088/g.38633 Transcript_28088/m.38633 type:complete len:219 (+) Transcript_28088:225-881(+)|eukprot:CAMPEP_0170076936 /NCGR_PEP_ID=MMETSP0019_2-20121128/13850_1 /TAXON_ID=98059 /ORGANISM="Dinobryon sp., Strain UTEXLB2267" /LENGTH=218 /DNA_ID=CAMNT_0010288957 /DNA_START=187 /DNA_END=843 /DNA_ORIENTATION=-
MAIVNLRINHEFPQSLLDERSDNGSVRASRVFNHDEDGSLRAWFRQRLLNLGSWNECPHPPDEAAIVLDASHDFCHYIPDIKALNLKVWNVENDPGANMYLNLHDSLGRLVALGGQPDYLISAPTSTKADYLHTTKCIIELQSHENIELCEYQIQLCLLILMNIRGLMNLYGFLIQSDGNCRAYCACRGAEGNGMYEKDSVFHVSHLAYVIRELLQTS